MPVPAIGLKKRLPKAWLLHKRILVCCMTKVMVCSKTIPTPATGMKKLLRKDWLPRNTILVSFTTVGWV